ncbi:MAG: cupin domain-containing protein [Pseudooceanicola sp.]
MDDETYIVTAAEIAAMQGLDKTHFLNPRAKRINKSLGDLAGLTGIGVHLIEVQPGDMTTEHHVHYHEDEALYVLSGTGTAHIGEADHPIGPGDFVGYRKGGAAHSVTNTGDEVLRCLVVGQRLPHDVGDYPRQAKRLFRSENLPWSVVDHEHIIEPKGAGKK